MRLGQNHLVARPATDSLLAHTLARAVVVWGGVDPEEPPSKWPLQLVGLKVTPRAVRVVAFVVFWALAMDELGIGDGRLDPRVYAKHGPDSQATTYRRLHDFAELWPDVDINDLGRAVLAAAKRSDSKPSPETRVAFPRLSAAAA